MTTADQLLADASWRRRHSVYALWAIFGGIMGIAFVSLLYTGIRAGNRRWLTWGVVYGVLGIGSFAVVGELSPQDSDAASPVLTNIGVLVWIAVWVGAAIHTFVARRAWLRWKAAASWQPQWYDAQPSEVPEPHGQPENLAAIGLNDPTADYLASPRQDPSHADERPLPPQPAAADTPGTVDLNTASVEEIAAIAGVGIASAHRIVEERERRGGFDSVDEAAVAVKLQPHVRSRLQVAATVSEKPKAQRRGPSGRIVDI